MKFWLIVFTLLVFGSIGYFIYACNKKHDATISFIRACPDEMIINKMPGTQPQSSYYIVDGVRREIAEFDAEWVKDNCSVPVQEVY